MRNRRFFAALLVAPLVLSVVGCDSVKRKFVRKRKTVQGPEAIFTLEKEYRPEFSPEVRYQAHFAYWKAAHDDLLEDLRQGATRARRMRAVNQSIKELRSMQELLEGSPVSGLEEMIGLMEKAKTRLDDPTVDGSRTTVVRSQLEMLRRRIDKRFDYHKVKSSLKPDLSLLPAQADAAAP
ncbi:MAG: hypothetical protein HY594_00390 [Candidatus Omnitrophica bacterium]|nr:hypothetical protein [Candidatus Omnitrophota bacterium]